MNTPQQKAKGISKGLTTIKFMNYQDEKKRRKQQFRNLKRKLKKVINCLPCQLLRKISSKCELCPIINMHTKKYFIDIWLGEDISEIVWVNCEYDKLIRFWLKLFRRIK